MLREAPGRAFPCQALIGGDGWLEGRGAGGLDVFREIWKLCE